ncbi:MAG: SPOR domain-containing protein [Novosphingobium sp.]|nr:SPOR domain-containing protein [Novosphingobium sp.]
MSATDAGRAALDAGRPETAIDRFREALDTGEPRAPALNGMAVAYARTGQRDLAKNYFEEAIQEDPLDPRYKANLAALSASPEASGQRRDGDAGIGFSDNAARVPAGDADVAGGQEQPGRLRRLSAHEFYIATVPAYRDWAARGERMAIVTQQARDADVAMQRMAFAFANMPSGNPLEPSDRANAAPVPASRAPARLAARPVPMPAPSPRGTGAGWQIQLGAFSGERGARDVWAHLRRHVALSGFAPAYVKFDRGTRLRTGPFTSRAKASDACAALRSLARAGCFVVPAGERLAVARTGRET